MHTTKIGDVAFLHDGDYDGDVLIGLPKEAIGECTSDKNYVYAKISFHVLKSFIASYVRCKKVSELESSYDDEILGLN